MIEHNGKQYARVSEILQPFTKFGNIKPEVLARKCQIGTNVHQAINDILIGDFPLITEGMGYVSSFDKWWDTINPELVETEMRYFNDEKMITGQIDCLVKLPHSILGLPVLIDWKTSSSPSATWEMQACLYSFLLSTNGKLNSSKALFIQLNKYGSFPKVHEYIWTPNIYAKCMKAIDDFWEKQK